MELEIDLLEKGKKSIFRVGIGILFLVISSGRILERVVCEEVISSFDWIYSGLFALLGILHIIGGLGFHFEKYLGESYIRINSEVISLKADIFGKEQSIYWNDIKSIEYKSNKFRIEKTDNTNAVMSLSKFSYSLKNEIKKAVDCIAKEKNIKLTM